MILESITVGETKKGFNWVCEIFGMLASEGRTPMICRFVASYMLMKLFGYMEL